MQATLNITWARGNGTLPETVPFDATDAEVLAWAREAVINGLPGIPADPNANLTGYMIDRYPADDTVDTNRLFVRPKTSFGQI